MRQGEFVTAKATGHTSTGGRVKFGAQDWAILHRFECVVDGFGQLLGSNCEIVLHALEDPSRSVIRIANGSVTGRTIGSPMTDFGMQIVHNADKLESDVVGVYHTRSNRGTPLKSVTVLIRNPKGRPIGMLCINMDLAVPLVDFARELLASAQATSETTVEHFPLNATDLISSALEEAMAEANHGGRLSAREKNRLVVAQMHGRGVFRVKGAVDIVARKMGISRYTVYNYLREARVDSALEQ
ncbi:MAG: PAS domain-containing protein [Dehalococcoidia bacterium]|nr:PAS domain-containing protein [Dehalococcoidia bacterium]